MTQSLPENGAFESMNSGQLCSHLMSHNKFWNLNQSVLFPRNLTMVLWSHPSVQKSHEQSGDTLAWTHPGESGSDWAWKVACAQCCVSTQAATFRRGICHEQALGKGGGPGEEGHRLLVVLLGKDHASEMTQPWWRTPGKCRLSGRKNLGCVLFSWSVRCNLLAKWGGLDCVQHLGMPNGTVNKLIFLKGRSGLVH